MKERDWRTLVHSIRQGNCILVLGPEIPVLGAEDDFPAAGPDGEPLPEQFFGKRSTPTLPEMLAQRLAMDVSITNLDPFHLAQAAEFYAMRYGRNDLEAEVVSFYQEQASRESDVYTQLAGLPFPLIISLSHDTGLTAALESAGRAPVLETYDFRGGQKDIVGVGAAERPLVYNLYGHIDNPQSLVISESDVLDFLSAVISRTPDLPNDLRSQLRDNNKSFLLLGFGLTRWYLRLLLHILKVDEKETRSFALEELPDGGAADLQRTILFMRRGLRIESFDFEVRSFVENLGKRLGDAGVRTPSGSVQAVSVDDSVAAGPKVFISYASEDEAAARRLHDALAARGFDAWIDKEGLRGGDRWNDVIPDALGESDYCVVLQSAAMSAKTFSYVNREIDLALERQKFARRGIRFIIPARLDDSPLLPELAALQAIDLTDDGGLEALGSAMNRDQQRRRKRSA